MKCKYNSVDEETIVAQTLNWFLFIAQVAIWAGNSRLVFGFTLEPINRKKTPTLRNQQSSKPESVFHRGIFHVNIKSTLRSVSRNVNLSRLSGVSLIFPFSESVWPNKK